MVKEHGMNTPVSTANSSEKADLENKSTRSKTSCPACGANIQLSCGDVANIKNDGTDSDDNASAPNPTRKAEGESGETTEKTDDAASKKLTRIGRISKDGTGKINIVDEAEWEAPPDPAKNGAFAITLQKEDLGKSPWGQTIEGEEEMSIVSPTLQDLFRSVVKYYPGIGLDGSQVTFTEPYSPLFFYYEAMRSAAAEDPASKSAEEFAILELFYETWVQQKHKRIHDDISHGIIHYTDLWALFRPGELIYGLDDMSQPCLYMLVATQFREAELSYSLNDDFSSRRFKRMCADLWQVTWDDASKRFQRLTMTRAIITFAGGRLITSLPFYPLKHYKDGTQDEIDELLSMLEARGKLWKKLVSEPPSCRSYSGSAMRQDALEFEPLSERVVVDGPASFNQPSPNRMNFGFINGYGAFGYQDREFPMFSDGLTAEHASFDNFSAGGEFTSLQAQLCPSSVSGCSLKSRKWYNICVSRIDNVDWAKQAWDHLVLEQKTKSMLLGLVQRHRKNKDEILSDVIPSKGKGLVVVLYGPPGVGKTLTAETVAEYTQKPLYPLNIGELSASTDVVAHLQKAFDTASRWDAVLLLDEADVLLEKRSYENLVRNGIVSVFLRMLEYYEGILFLTTNRVETMDVAFQSRIHIAIKYNPLSPAVRRQIWENFIHRLDKREEEGKQELLDHLDDMQEWELNGRQIRNVLGIAESIALSQERRRGALRYHHVEDVTNETINFDRFFDESQREKKGQVGGLNNRQFQEKRLKSWK